MKKKMTCSRARARARHFLFIPRSPLVLPIDEVFVARTLRTQHMVATMHRTAFDDTSKRRTNKTTEKLELAADRVEYI